MENLIVVLRRGMINEAKSLLDNGSNVNATDVTSGWTYLFYACKFWCNMDIIKFLLSYGADVNAKSKSNKRILDYTETIRYPNIYNYIKLHKRIKGI